MIIDKHKLARSEQYTLRLADQRTDLPLTYSVGHIGVGSMVLMKTGDRRAAESGERAREERGRGRALARLTDPSLLSPPATAALTLLGLRRKRPLQEVINEARTQSPMVFHTRPGKMPDKQRVKNLHLSGENPVRQIDDFLKLIYERIDAEENAAAEQPATATTPDLPDLGENLSVVKPAAEVGAGSASSALAAAAVARPRTKRRASTKTADVEISVALQQFAQQASLLSSGLSSVEDTSLSKSLLECRFLSEAVGAQSTAVTRLWQQCQVCTQAGPGHLAEGKRGLIGASPAPGSASTRPTAASRSSRR